MSRENAIKFLRDISMGIDYLENAYSANRQIDQLDDNSLRVRNKTYLRCKECFFSLELVFVELSIDCSDQEHNNYNNNNDQANHFGRKVSESSFVARCSACANAAK